MVRVSPLTWFGRRGRSSPRGCFSALSMRPASSYGRTDSPCLAGLHVPDRWASRIALLGCVAMLALTGCTSYASHPDNRDRIEALRPVVEDLGSTKASVEVPHRRRSGQ